MAPARHLVRRTRSGSRPTPSCRTARSWRGSRPTSSSWTWSRTASRCGSTARRVTVRHGPDRLGHRRHQRPARLLPAAPPGHPDRAADLIGFVNPTTEVGDHHDLLMANLFAQAEAFAFGKTREEVVAAGVPDAPGRRPGVRGQPADVGHPRGPADAADPRHARRAVRAQGVRAGRDLGDRLVRPVGRGAGQGPGDADRRRAARGATSRWPPTTTRRRRPSSPGSGRGGSGRRAEARASGATVAAPGEALAVSSVALLPFAVAPAGRLRPRAPFRHPTLTIERRSATLARTPRKWQGARTPSGLKRVRQAERRRAILQPRRSAAKTLVAKAVTVATGAGRGQRRRGHARARPSRRSTAPRRPARSTRTPPRAASRASTRKVNAAVGGTAVVSAATSRSAPRKAAAAKAAKARIAAGKAVKAKGAQTAAGKARAALSKTTRAETAAAGGRGREATTEAGPEDDQGRRPSRPRRPAASKSTATKAKAVDRQGRARRPTAEDDRREDDEGQEGRVVLDPRVTTDAPVTDRGVSIPGRVAVRRPARRRARSSRACVEFVSRNTHAAQRPATTVAISETQRRVELLVPVERA